MAPGAGFEPATNRLTADRSTTELSGSVEVWPTARSLDGVDPDYISRLNRGGSEHLFLTCQLWAFRSLLFTYTELAKDAVKEVFASVFTSDFTES